MPILINKYANGKLSDAPTIGTIKKIAIATKTVSYEELLIAAGYDAEKYKDDRPIGAVRKDFFHPVFLGMANSPYDWRIESKGYKDNEPFEIIIERADVNKWFFMPIKKRMFQRMIYRKQFLVSQSSLRVVRLALLQTMMKFLKKTVLKTDLSIKHEDEIRPYQIGEAR